MSISNKQYNVVFQLDLEQKNAKISIAKIKNYARERNLEFKSEEIDGWVDISFSIFTNYENIKNDIDKLLLIIKNFDVRCSVDIYESIPKLHITFHDNLSIDSFKELVYELDKKNNTIRKSIYNEDYKNVIFHFINTEERTFFLNNLTKNIHSIIPKDNTKSFVSKNIATSSSFDSLEDTEYVSIFRKNNYLNSKKTQKY